jgi:large subunit ribosomal protein L23
MKVELYYDLIKRPVISEKATLLAEFNKYVFKVDCNATKSQVKSAIEKIFNVKVKSVNTIKIQGKIKRFRGVLGKQNNYKKAIVTLMPDNHIDISGGVK